MRRMVFVVAALVCATAGVQAAPVVPEHLAADAQWFGHANVEALCALPIVKQAQKCLSESPCSGKIKELFGKLGVNPCEDVLGATLYSTKYGGKSAVVLLYLRKYDREKILDFFKDRSTDHQVAEGAVHTVYSCTLTHGSKKMPLVGAFPKDNMIVIGACPKCVAAALEVLDGKKPALAKNAPLVKGIAAGALFVSRAPAVPEATRKSTKCPVLHSCVAASVEWSESKGQIQGRYDLQAESAETAKSFKAIVDGLQALGALRCGEMPAFKKLLAGLKCEVQGDHFLVNYRAAMTDVEAAAKAAHELHKAHPGQCPLGKCPLGGSCPLGKDAAGKCACPPGRCNCPADKCQCPPGKCTCPAAKCPLEKKTEKK